MRALGWPRVYQAPNGSYWIGQGEVTARNQQTPVAALYAAWKEMKG